MTLHGIARELQVPVRIENGTDSIAVTGGMALKQTDFGIAPLSVLGGAIQVQDQVDLRFRLYARSMDSGREPIP